MGKVNLAQSAVKKLEFETLKFAVGCVSAVQDGATCEAKRCAEIAAAFGVARKIVLGVFAKKGAKKHGR